MTDGREIVVRIQLDYPPAPAAAEPAAMDQPLLFTVEDAARMLAVGKSTINELIARREIQSVKIGTSRRLTRTGIEAYVRTLLAADDT